MLLFAASQIQIDRTNREPVVTYGGPIADYVPYVAVFGWALSAIAIVLGASTLHRFSSRFNRLAVVAMGLAFFNFVASSLYSVGALED